MILEQSSSKERDIDYEDFLRISKLLQEAKAKSVPAVDSILEFHFALKIGQEVFYGSEFRPPVKRTSQHLARHSVQLRSPEGVVLPDKDRPLTL